ncbi:MAG: hypothetical protein ACRDFB_05120 [Rhabdochlamydiaceae bacterium]
MGQGYELKLIQDYEFDECASALQKSVRRSYEFEACFWVTIFYKSGFRGYLSRRLQTIANEDCGVANIQALILANQLVLDEIHKQKDKERYQKTKLSGDGLLPFINLVIIMCRGEKTRLGDEIVNLLQDGIGKGDLHLEVPEFAIDPHVELGKLKFGKWESGTKEESYLRIKNWFCSWSRLTNEAAQSKIYNPYKQALMKLWGYYSGDAPVIGTHYTNLNNEFQELMGKDKP